MTADAEETLVFDRVSLLALFDKYQCPRAIKTAMHVLGPYPSTGCRPGFRPRRNLRPSADGQSRPKISWVGSYNQAQRWPLGSLSGDLFARIPPATLHNCIWLEEKIYSKAALQPINSMSTGVWELKPIWGELADEFEVRFLRIPIQRRILTWFPLLFAALSRPSGTALALRSPRRVDRFTGS